MYIKTGIILCAWLASYFNYLHAAATDSPVYSICAVVFLFITSSALSLNVIHEGSHRSFSSSKQVNQCLQMLIACIYGVSTINWFQKHIRRHHVYTNIRHQDFDINSKGVFRFAPSDTWRSWHQWQEYYALPLYSLYVLKWIYLTDVRDLVLNIYDLPATTRGLVLLEIMITRLSHIVLFIIIPSHFFSSLSLCIMYYVVFALLSGLTTAVIFQLAHVVPNLSFYTSSNIIDSRLHHQLSSTANFAAHNKYLTYFTGGLNMQVVHHLFPHISHLDYPTIEPVIKTFCLKNHLPYHEYPSVISAIKAHLAHLKYQSIKPIN